MLPPRMPPPRTRMRRKFIIGTWLKLLPMSLNQLVKPVIELASQSSDQPPDFCSGLIRQATTRARGYSTTPVKIKGANRPLNTPPSMPPTDIHRKNSVRCLGDG